MKQIQLNNGTSIPGIGFGTGTALYGQECADMILSALEHGYTYLDCAQMYGNAASIGTALKRWKGKREDVYILTKMGMEKVEHTDPREALQEQLKLMGVDYVDMYLCHAPYLATPSLGENWKAMEQLVKDGLTKSIGVSNYASEDIEELSKIWTIPPAVNQIEYNPYVYHAPNMLRLRETLDKHGIKIQAYGPLNSVHRVTGGPVDPVANRIAEAHNVTESQVLLAWASQFGGGCVVTTSRNDQRQKEQLAAIDLELTKEEVDEIAEAGKGKFARYFMHRAWDRAKP